MEKNIEIEKELKKNSEHIVEIVDNGYEGEGIARINDFAVFIPNALKGEKVKIVIVKVLTSYAFGKILEIIEKSPNRVDSDCKTYKRCGGCNLRHVKYHETLKMKQSVVQNLVNKMLKNKIQVEETLGMENPLNYRNKAQYPVGLNKFGKPEIGVFANRTHEIIPIEKCLIQNSKTEEIAKFLLKYIEKNRISIYNEKTGKGVIRHIVTRIGVKTNEIMLIIVINGKSINNEGALVKELTTKFPEIKTIVRNINTKNTNVILGNLNRNIYGKGYIKDKLGEYTFKISPNSFYQVNPIQTEYLYELGVKAAEISKEDTVFDLYSGIGTISIFMSKYAKKVYGIEIVESAINNAKENIILNKIDNVEFVLGDVEKALDDLVNKKKISADVVMIDPPRKGMDNKSIENLLKIKPKKIVYISCNPSTLIRDISKFEDEYEVKNIKPVDMFPFTTHVECVTVLERK